MSQYPKVLHGLQECSETDRRNRLRNLCRIDLYFLIRYILGRQDIEHPWLFERCREVQREPNGYLDLWAREHYKSTIITYGKTIQDILASHGDYPLEHWQGVEPTFGIFSHTRPIAKGFLRQIKRELESHEQLKDLFPDILWSIPNKEAPKWSEDDGLILKRKSNPKESTIEAWGLVDGQPISKHFFVRVYDDIVTRESVSNPQMIGKVTEAWELSLNLGVEGGYERYTGTRYHFSDTYAEMMKRNAAKKREYPATETGTADGRPVLLTQASLDDKRTRQGPYTFACQQLLDPKQDASQGFKREWWRTYEKTRLSDLNRYILVDPANEKKKGSDYTAMWCIGLGEDGNIYALDLIRDRLNLSERTDLLFDWHKKYTPLKIGYEKYGMQADVEHIRSEMEHENYRFSIQELGGSMAKHDRIRRLVPWFEQHRIWLPEQKFHTTTEGKSENMVRHFQEEFDGFPVTLYDDMLDALSRLCDEDLSLKWPKRHRERPELPEVAVI